MAAPEMPLTKHVASEPHIPPRPAHEGPHKPVSAVCVYCGASFGRDPAYLEAALALGRTFAGAGLRLVYGGGDVGLMGSIARAVIDAGGHVTGIIPGFLRDREVMLTEVNELIVTKDMHERKRLMFEHADAFVAMPGGIGTLEEVVEMMTWSQLGQHDKPIVLFDVRGFWQPLVSLIDHMRNEAFIRPQNEIRFHVESDPEKLVALLRSSAPKPGDAAVLKRM